MTPPATEKRPFGRTGLKVTPICFGTSGLGDMPETYGYSVEAQRAQRTVEAIFDGPVNFIDTSRIYGVGRSEARIGAVIRERGLPAGMVVSTKLDRDPNTHVFDASQARRSIEESLKALGLEKIDLLHLHDPEHAASFAQATGRDGALGELLGSLGGTRLLNFKARGSELELENAFEFFFVLDHQDAFLHAGSAFILAESRPTGGVGPRARAPAPLVN